MSARKAHDSVATSVSIREMADAFSRYSKTTTPPHLQIQRSCDCGAETELSGICASCATEEKYGIQPKLTIGPQDDAFEQEADEIADQVGAGDSTATSPLPSAAAVAKGGQPLSRSERTFFEPRFGRDLSHVRLHRDTAAAEAARNLSARAFTLHNHIVFAAEQYRPDSIEGRRLIAHELTHTLQQGSSSTIRRLPTIPGMNDGQRRSATLDFPDRLPHMDDPRGPGPHSTLTYAQSRELNRCIDAMGDGEVARAECAHMVLGTPLPEWRSVAGISSPVPFRSHVSSAGAATLRIGLVNLTILPDAQSDDPAMQDRAETEIRPQTLAAGTHLVEADTMNGRVTSFSVNPAAFNLTIQTTYGPGVTAASTSGYGRGTTEADERTESTSLGFHEGEHGRDFINFLRNNPYPEFTGHNGQSATAFSARITQFETALQDYVRRMNRASVLATDCVGTTIDDYNADNGTATTTCVVSTGNP